MHVLHLTLYGIIGFQIKQSLCTNNSLVDLNPLSPNQKYSLNCETGYVPLGIVTLAAGILTQILWLFLSQTC